MNAVARPLALVVNTATETTDTAVETAAVVTAEMIAGAAAEEVAEKAAEKTSEEATKKATERAARPVMMLKIESKLMILRTEMIDVDDIFGSENLFLRHVKLAL